jgi:hypothetical protein
MIEINTYKNLKKNLFSLLILRTNYKYLNRTYKIHLHIILLQKNKIEQDNELIVHLSHNVKN